jgi:hypothetical protein
MQKSQSCRHSTKCTKKPRNQINHVTVGQNVRNDPPYRPVFGCAPPPTKLSRFGSLNPPTSVLWVCTPSILLFSDHSALRHTKSLRTPCSRTLPLSLCSHVLLLLGVSCLLPAFPRSMSGFRTLVDTVVLVTP